MADGLYKQGRTEILDQSTDWIGDSFSIVVIDATDYTVDLDNDRWLSDIPSGARQGTAALSGRTVINGACDAEDLTLTVTGIDDVDAIIIYKDTGTEATSTLIAYIDSATGLPHSPGVADIVWSQTADRIFRISGNSTTAVTDTDRMVFSSGANKNSAFTAPIDTIVKTDASGGTFTVTAPGGGTPAADARFGVVDRVDTETEITVDGDGVDVQDPSTFEFAATITPPAGASLWIWQYDDDADQFVLIED